ncbi:transmembrane protein 183A-like [Tigriopus californicus]|uniref:transmembrane protein 183A-like n=1 Tax=Tigriopus californicus TaxID=6832 RepID=UPI0027D9D8B3|nr:transmembrane protein 183A-like [Tigriopus californicus]
MGGKRRRNAPRRRLIPDLALPADHVSVQHFADAKPDMRGKSRVSKSLLSASSVRGLEKLNQSGAILEEHSSLPDDWEEPLHDYTVDKMKGMVYDVFPSDFWDVLSRHIEPPEVQTFSLINRYTWAIVRTAGFWAQLFRRYYRPDAHLPEELDPTDMRRLRGLKSRVIRSLFYLYKPYLTAPRKKIQEPYLIKGYICQKWWLNQINGKGFQFFFKFQKQRKSQLNKWGQRPKVPAVKFDQDQVEDQEVYLGDGSRNMSYCDIFHNPEDSCVLLEIRTNGFCHVPYTILGSKLIDISVNVCGAGFQFQKLAMSFVPAHQYSINCDNLTSVILNGVAAFRLVNWYEPTYMQIVKS